MSGNNIGHYSHSQTQAVFRPKTASKWPFSSHIFHYFDASGKNQYAISTFFPAITPAARTHLNRLSQARKDTPMPVYRVKKDRNFTAMSNHHLQNRGLSLRAKGLLSLMLSLPDDWQYSLKGLAAISQEEFDGITIENN